MTWCKGGKVIDEGVDIQVALGKVLRAIGVKEFAGKVRIGQRENSAAIREAASKCRR